MKTRRILLIVLAILLPLISNARTVVINEIYYDLTEESKSAEVVSPYYAEGIYVTYRGTIIIPESISIDGVNYSVTSIGQYAFSRNTNLTSVTIPNSVTLIRDYAFYCTGLTSITIPNGVITIGNASFTGCTGLTSVIIPNSVTTIGASAFKDCTGLTSIIISNSVTTIGAGAFSGCDGLTSITFPPSVMSIGDYAFCDCPGLISIIIPNSVTTIGGSAFKNCTGLNSIIIPNSVTTIGGSAFYGCTGLTSVTIPPSVTSIGSGAFDNCTDLSSVKVQVTDFSSFCKNKTIKLVCLQIKKPFTLVDKDYKEIKDFIVPDDVITIGESTFYNCTGLSSVTIPNSVSTIGNEAFNGCTGLTSITIPNSVKSIGDYAFYDCTSLTSITFPFGITSIGQYAFSRCTGLTSVTIPHSVTSIGSGVFDKCTGLLSVKVQVRYFSSFCKNRIIGLVSSYISKPVILVDKNYKEINEYIVPDDVTAIGDGAFKHCTGLTSVIIPNSVTSIGNEAFNGCAGLTSVTIPNSVTTIGASAFQDCTGLSSITFPPGVTSIGEHTFGGCTSMQIVKSFIAEPYSINKNVFPVDTYRNATLYIPVGTEKLYTRYDGWREFLKIQEMDESERPIIPGAEKCATPTIRYENGMIRFSCETEGVEYKYKIEANDANEGHGNDIQVTKTYKVSVYAFKDGMNNSDSAVANILIAGGKDGDVNADGVVNAADIVTITKIIMNAKE